MKYHAIFMLYNNKKYFKVEQSLCSCTHEIKAPRNSPKSETDDLGGHMFLRTCIQYRKN